MLSGPKASGICLYPMFQVLELHIHVATHDFYIGAWNSNSDLHACTLLSELSSSPTPPATSLHYVFLKDVISFYK